MASHIDEEQCFEDFFANEPKLQLHYFMIKSLYEGDRDPVLYDWQLARQFRIQKCGVYTAVEDINQWSPEAVSFKQNSGYRKTIITQKGKTVLQHDLAKLVPQDGVFLKDLKKSFSNELINEYLLFNWLGKDKRNRKVIIVRGEKYEEFVMLFTSLGLFDKSEFLKNEKDLAEFGLIELIEGRLEITRGVKFPIVHHEKLLLLYKLAEDCYIQNIKCIKVTLNRIQQQEEALDRYLEDLVKERKGIDKNIEQHNVNSFRLIWQQQNIILMEKHISSMQPLDLAPPHLRQPQMQPISFPPPNLLLTQPQEQLQQQVPEHFLAFPFAKQQRFPNTCYC